MAVVMLPAQDKVLKAISDLRTGPVEYTEHSAAGPPAAQTTLPKETRPSFLDSLILPDSPGPTSKQFEVLSEEIKLWAMAMLSRLGFDGLLDRIQKDFESEPPYPSHPGILCETWSVPTTQDHPLARHEDNVNGHDQVTLVMYPLGNWEGGGIEITTQPGHYKKISSTDKNGWVVVAFGGDVEHLPTAPTRGVRKCVVFHVGKVWV